MTGPAPTGPSRSGYDTVIVGGAVMGSSVAYWLSENPDFDGSVRVCGDGPDLRAVLDHPVRSQIRHQFSEAVNVRLSMFATEFIADFHENVQVDGESPDLGFRDTGYLFLATGDGMEVLRENHKGAAVMRSRGGAADRRAATRPVRLPVRR
ncbi:MAG: hypothetical protein Ct9H300mP31_09280 [Acidimicrobiaceae bacterium]|nr:MAG: hypothetical protein Ct9H300mP31_09280 [Acidimicrobiaceae bacterium]